MSGGGYDIGLSFSSSSAAQLTSPFILTGGGGGNAPGATAATKPNDVAVWLLAAGAALIAIFLFSSK